MMHSTPSRAIRWAICIVAMASVFVTGIPFVLAQTGSGQALYDEGVTAYGNRDFDTACAKFEASYQAESAPAALFMLGKCERARGRWVAARAHFLKVAETERDDAKMVEHARSEASEIAGLLPKITLRLAPSAPPSSTVTLDGAAVRPDVATEVDPGAHEVVVTSEGFAPTTRKVTLAERQVIELELGPGAASQGGVVVEPRSPGTASGSSGMKVAGIVVTSVGAALAATAIVTSVWIAAGCGGESEGNAFGCARDGDGYASPYGALLPINAVGWIGGVVGLGVGIPLLVVGSASDGSASENGAGVAQVTFTITPGGAGLRGRF